MDKNKIKHPALVIWFSIMVLLLLSMVKLPVIPYLNNYSHIDILEDLKESKKPVLAHRAVPATPKSAASVPGSKAGNNIYNPDSSIIRDYAPDGVANMRTFYQKLLSLKAKKGKVRIAYFGDSFIEADYITGELRNRLQAMFGGNGIGFLPMQSVVADDYVYIRFSNNTNWVDYNFQNNPKKYALSPMGHVFLSTGNSWSQFGAVNKKFTNISLVTGLSPDAADNVQVEKDGIVQQVKVANGNTVNITTLNEGVPVTKCKITCASNALPVYGINIDDTTGVYIDNFGFRGNTGALNLQLQPELLKAFADNFKYELVILHYGLNAVEHNHTRYDWFDNVMTKMVGKVRSTFGNVPILMVSTSDIAYNDGGTYVTDPGVPALVNTQYNIAHKNKTAFFDLYNAMGGENTIASWAEGDTVYAYKDYMHVNERGAAKIAGIFCDKILHFK